MIKKENFIKLLEQLDFIKRENIYIKKFPDLKTELRVDIKKQELIYPERDGFTIHERQTCNFKQAENFVVFECVHRLLNQGYHPKHIELEPKWQLGHGASGGRADILVKDNSSDALLIIECKTAGGEFKKAWDTTQIKPTQLFSYVQQTRTTKFIALYASDLVDGEVNAKYYLISLCDNEKLLENDKELKAYRDANTVEEIYEVWSRTYQKDYASIGLFEDTQAYHIGKDRYSLSDLKTVTSRDIQGKYHEFATIMRQHNVSGRENAFDKLVNLFLCKVVDETNNSDELKFYWKGVAYDDPFSLQDRLNHLYKVGMKKFLGEDITYIENSQIDDAFSVFADRPNMTKEIIQGFFKELKFFTNNDFAFVDVHNEELFYQNFEVLLKVVKMLQDIKLTGGEDNQFLGDMFEGFLDQGVKQSEGQFFTPMPIVKFIINSLPLDEIQKREDNPKVIDYACGAGHFLNEVANNFPKEYHKNIVGVEKEYRLSKVAKVSSFMYGQDEVKIVYHDALSPIDEIKDSDYSVLVANPPYSVKGFLETLKERDRANYELIDSLEEKSFISNNAIECFFIERAKQLLKKDAVVGIILPSSILSKGSGNNIYVKTREILLKYFEIVAIAEFGSGTFGKTGTNTVTLFLKRRADNPDIQKHLKYMVDAWFDGDFAINEHFRDNHLLENYSKHIEVDLELYKTLLKNEYASELFENEMFGEYQEEFKKLSETKKRKKQKYYKELKKEEKEQRERKELISYVRKIEQDKLYYFSLAYLNPKEVLIVKAPTNGAKNKKFLGYEWSGRKGDEGIKYITSGKAVKLKEGAEALENILNLGNIQTPLYNPKDKYDNSKINSLIAKNFSDEVVEIPNELEEFVTKAWLVDMLDFSRKEFSKGIGLSPKKKAIIIGKPEWQVKLGDVVEVIAGQSPKSEFYNENKNGLPFFQGKKDFGEIYLKNPTVWTSKITKTSVKNDLLMSVRAPVGTVNINPFEKICIGRGLAILRVNEPITQRYLFEFCDIHKNYFKGNTGAIFDSISSNDLRNTKIPIPPLKIQKEIIKKCELVDDEVIKANEEIKNSNIEIEQKFKDAFSKSTQTFKLSDSNSFTVSIGKRVLQKEVSQNKNLTPIYSANVFEIFGYIEKELLKDFTKPSVIWGIDGDWMVNYIPKDKPFYPTDHCGVLRVDNRNLHPKYLAWVLDQEGKEARFSRTMRASINRIKGIIIKAPSIDEQKEIVQKIEKLEAKITKAQSVIDGASGRKEAVLREYL